MKAIGGGRNADGPEIALTLTLRGICAANLINAALARRRDVSAVLADVIEIVCIENMFDAVLDDGGAA